MTLSLNIFQNLQLHVVRPRPLSKGRGELFYGHPYGRHGRQKPDSHAKISFFEIFFKNFFENFFKVFFDILWKGGFSSSKIPSKKMLILYLMTKNCSWKNFF